MSVIIYDPETDNHIATYDDSWIHYPDYDEPRDRTPVMVFEAHGERWYLDPDTNAKIHVPAISMERAVADAYKAPSPRRAYRIYHNWYVLPSIYSVHAVHTN